ncbi:MAG: hypothetical protein DRN08_01525 [Thermoplasmata archaeon]|nr:MAG: hypothetical protein DRN08_01525 [Thermoplasmata archaeon]
MSRVVIVGIDGMTPELVERWMDEGYLPCFQSFRRRGVWGWLASTNPPFSAPAWTSIVTGCGPGRHGVYGFERTDTLEQHLINSRYRRVPAIWNFLTDIGLRSIVVNVPGTYPPERINGVMITGLLTPSSNSDFTYPRNIRDRLRSEDLGEYELEQLWVDDFSRSYMIRHDPNRLLSRIIRSMSSHARVTLNLMKQFNWDFTMVVLRELDTAQHFFFNRKDLLLSCYEKVDEIVDEMLSSFPDAVFFIVSDHGFEEIKKILYPDNVLYNAGFLKPVHPPYRNPLSLLFSILFNMHIHGRLGVLLNEILSRSDFARKIFFSGSSKSRLIDFSKTMAFSTADGRGIRICSRDKYHMGIVDPDVYEKTCLEIIRLFKDVRDPISDEEVVDDVLRCDQVYGKDAWHPPDLILRLKRGVTAMEWLRSSDSLNGYSEFINRSLPPVFYNDPAGRSGDHAPFGVFFGQGKGIRSGYEIRNIGVEDVLPLVFAALGLPLPENIDGRLHEDVFVEKPRVTRIDWSQYVSSKKVLLDAEKEKILDLRKKINLNGEKYQYNKG